MPLKTALAIPLLALLCACTGSTQAPVRPSVDLAITDFSDPGATVARPEPVALAQPDSGATPAALNTTVGAPEPATDAQPTGRRVVVDTVVGQINGKPIYAEEFYRESADYWREQSTRVSSREWTQEIAADSQSRLMTQVREELLLAEFRANLTKQQKQGLLAFVENLRKQAVSGAGGSEQELAKRIREEYGEKVDDYIKRQAEREIIIQQLRATIVKRVQVSTRDVELYYKRHIDEFRPQPLAVIRKIRLDQSDDQARDTLEALIAAGDFPIDGSSVDEIQLDPEGREATVFYAIDPLNHAARTLRPGEVAGPFEVGTGLWWLTLEELREQPQRSLYDVQLQIEETIRDQRLRQEESRYFERLLARSNVSEFQEMLAGLLEYATDRLYLPGNGG